MVGGDARPRCPRSTSVSHIDYSQVAAKPGFGFVSDPSFCRARTSPGYYKYLIVAGISARHGGRVRNPPPFPCDAPRGAGLRQSGPELGPSRLPEVMLGALHSSLDPNLPGERDSDSSALPPNPKKFTEINPFGAGADLKWLC